MAAYLCCRLPAKWREAIVTLRQISQPIGVRSGPPRIGSKNFILICTLRLDGFGPGLESRRVGYVDRFWRVMEFGESAPGRIG
jgi:hypothetical protein